MPPVNRTQFNDMARRLNQPGGGFSVHLKTGEEPTSGIMVSQAGSEGRFEPGEHVGGREVAAHAIEHESKLKGPRSYHGGWHDDITGARTLDVSRRYNVKSAAYKAMWSNDQDGAYDLDRSDSASGEGGHTIHNFAKHGTAGTTLGKYLTEEPMNPQQYAGLRTAAARSLRDAPVRSVSGPTLR
jgi:hypothetical protein